MDALGDRQSLILGDRLETVARHDACQLAGRSIGADHGYVAQIGPRQRDNAQVRAVRSQYLAGIGAPSRSWPRFSGSAGRARSKNAIADPLARPQMRAVAQREGPTGAVYLKAENARRMLGIFQHRLMTPQPGIQRKNGLGQPRMTLRRLRPLLCGIPHRHQRVPAFSCHYGQLSHAEKVARYTV